MNCVHGAVGRYFRGRAVLGVRGAEAGSELRALAVPNFAARAAAADVLVYQASGEIPPRSRIRELGFRSARVAHRDAAHFRPATAHLQKVVRR